MKDGSNLGILKSEPKKYWKGENASSYVTSLPKDWVLEYPEKISPKELWLSQIGETLLITPKRNQDEKDKRAKPLELKMNRKNEDEVYYSVLSAYLQDYDQVCLKEEQYNPSLKKKLNDIDQKLPGAEFKRDGNDYLITFERRIEDIPKKIDEIYSHYMEMYSQNKKMFAGEIKEYDIEIEHDIVTKKETLVDNKVFALKRLFTHVFETLLHDPTILHDTGLVKDKKEIDYTAAYKIAGYRSVANTLERITDIQREVFELLVDFKKTKYLLPKTKDYGFPEYYDSAHEITKDAYTSKKVVEDVSISKDGFNCLLKVLAAEDNEKNNIRYRQDYISFENREDVLKLVKNSKSPQIGALEGYIWAITGLATNIAESWINMSNLEEINK